MKLKQLALIGFAITGINIASAQNPFVSFGEKANILTLSNGRYEEIQTNDTLVRVGTVIVNTRTNTIAGFVKQDSLKENGIMEPELVSRFLSLDPLASKYPEQSPYMAMGNNPILQIDTDGRENVIYLTNLALQNPKLSKTDKTKILNELNAIAKAANQGFKDKGLTQRVVIIDSYSKIPGANKLDKSDVLATIGNTQELEDFDDTRANNTGSKSKGDYDLIGISGMGPERSTSIGGYGGDAGDRIGINTDEIGNEPSRLGQTKIGFMAWLIQHGSGHNAAIAHTNETKKDYETQSNSKNPDIMTNGQYYHNNPGNFKKYANNVSSQLKGLFSAKGKFTSKEAKDNIFKKKIN